MKDADSTVHSFEQPRAIDPVLRPEDRDTVIMITSVMMEMNKMDDRNSSQGSTYGHLHNALVSFVKNQTGLNISNVDWNLGGNATFADDIQAALHRADELRKEQELELSEAPTLRRLPTPRAPSLAQGPSVS